MDNSSSMARSDADFHALAAADLVINMLRPGDTLSIVSSGADATIVMTGSGEDREALGAALRRLHREASVADPVAVLRLLADHYEAKKGGEAVPLVIWFTGRHFSYDVGDPDYFVSEKALSAQQAAQGTADPLKLKPFKDVLEEVVARVGEFVDGEAGVLADLGVPVHMALMGKSFEAPGVAGRLVTDFMAEAILRTGGDLLPFHGAGTDLLAWVVSTIVRTVNAPSLGVDQSTIGPKGENFEVLRGCRHLWIVLEFDRLPQTFGLVSSAAGSAKEWPFGKPSEDVHQGLPRIEKGMEYREKRWYRLPEQPVGFAVWSVRDPAPGNYRFVARFDEGVPFRARIIEDVDLVLDFLEEPQSSIPLGMDLSASLVLKNPQGFTYVFSRGFVDDLRFQVLVRSEDGSIPPWGDVREIQHSREGEASASFSPDGLGVYYLKGKVTSGNGEFVAFLEPFRFVVAPDIALDFEDVEMSWVSTDGEGWTDVRPVLALRKGVEIPEGVTFRIKVSKLDIQGADLIVLDPAESFTIGPDAREVGFRVRYKDPESLRETGARFGGKLRLSVDESQKAGVTGDGRWEIPIDGRLEPWGMGWLWREHGLPIAILLALALVVGLVVERRLRPAFPRDAVVGFTDRIGGRERTRTIEVGKRAKPLVPFLRQSVVIGHGGDAGFYSEGVLCRIEPARDGVVVRPGRSRVVADDESAAGPGPGSFSLEMGRRYRVSVGEEAVTFWMTRGADDQAQPVRGRRSRS